MNRKSSRLSAAVSDRTPHMAVQYGSLEVACGLVDDEVRVVEAANEAVPIASKEAAVVVVVVTDEADLVVS